MFDDFFGKKNKDKEENTSVNANTPEENSFLNKIINDQQKAESSRTDIEQVWDDEYKIFIGDQWGTSFAYRSPSAKKIRPNSVDNFVMPAIINIHASLTATTPESVFEPRGGPEDQDVADKLNPVVQFIKYKNKFPHLYKKITLSALQYGPLIGAVIWDNTWTGGMGPNRWIGDIRILHIKRKEFYPDPAIVDLEERLQDCSFIHRKLRRKLEYFKERWEDKGQFVIADDDTDDEEGQDAGQATLIESWHRGKPKFIPDEWKKYFQKKADESEIMGLVSPDPFKAARYRAMAEGEIDGVHVAYCTRDVFLEYIPYVYDDGLYPFCYKVLYEDEKSPWGFGEIRNVKVPQVMHNKADEIEIEAMSVEGLGGCFYNKGAMTPAQLAAYQNVNAKGGAAIEVNDIGGIKPREGPRIPAAITNYKEHKQRMIETISQNTPIQQGLKPGGVTAYSAIAELGERADTRTKGKAEIIEDFLTEMDQLIISRVAQFYTEERQWRITGSDGKSQSGTFSNREMVRTWEREPGTMEEYIPEMDVRVKVVDERPTSRNYYIQNAKELLGMKALDIESFWYTMEEGKFPPKEDILQRLTQPPPGQGNDPQAMLNAMPPEIQQLVQQMIPPEQMAAFLSQPPEQIAAQIQQMQQQMQGGGQVAV